MRPRRKSPIGDIDRRAVVDGADTHLQDTVGGPGGFAGEARGEVGMDIALGQIAGALGGDAVEIGAAGAIDAQEGLEDGGHQDGAAVVRFEGTIEGGLIGITRFP